MLAKCVGRESGLAFVQYVTLILECRSKGLDQGCGDISVGHVDGEAFEVW